jgi:molybdenum cofactor cytidylyltransferase
MARPLVAVLAAGLSTRFGSNKLEAVCAGKPLGRWAIEAVEAAGLGQGLIVFAGELPSYAQGWDHVLNGTPEEGLGSSLGGAAVFALERGATEMLVLLADMPLVTADYLRGLAEQPAPAASRYVDGHAGVPALLDRALIEDAIGLTGDRGAGPLLRRATLLDPPPGMLRDVDTPEDLREIELYLNALRHPRESGDPVGS